MIVGSATPARQPSGLGGGSEQGRWRVPVAAAVAKILIHLPVLGRYGYHHDELYFIACGRRLSFGYVDHAPLVPWIARLADELFDASLFGLRIFPVLAGATAILLVGFLVARLGGGRFAQVVACASMLAVPVYLRGSNMLHLPPFETLAWLGASCLVVRIVQEDSPRLWAWVGVVAGLGLLSKHSVLLFGFGLTVGLLLTPHRRQFRSPWLYVGGVIAAVIFLPNVLWQMANGWPTVEFLRALNAGTMRAISPALFLGGQLLYMNALLAPIWIGGLVYLLRSPAERPDRILAWIWLAVAAVLLVVGGKIYYLSPAYPPLFAAGGVAVERLAAIRGRGWLRPAVLACIVAGGLTMAPLSLPVLSIDTTQRFVDAVSFGASDVAYELTGDLRGMFGWKERAEAVARVWEELPFEQRDGAVVLAGWYGPAGAVEFFGRGKGLPPVVSTHVTYHLWGLPDGPLDTVIALDVPLQDLHELFEEVRVAAELEIPEANPWQRNVQIVVCRRPKVDLRAAWVGAIQY